MKLLRVVLSLLFVLYTTICSAEQDIVLTSIQVWSSASGDNVIRVITPGHPIVNPDGCTDPDSYFVRTTTAKEAQARIYATLLLARATNSPITVRIQGCELNRPAIRDVYL